MTSSTMHDIKSIYIIYYLVTVEHDIFIHSFHGKLQTSSTQFHQMHTAMQRNLWMQFFIIFFLRDLKKIMINLPVSPDPKGFMGLKCFNPICSPLSRICKKLCCISRWCRKRGNLYSEKTRKSDIYWTFLNEIKKNGQIASGHILLNLFYMKDQSYSNFSWYLLEVNDFEKQCFILSPSNLICCMNFETSR